MAKIYAALIKKGLRDLNNIKDETLKEQVIILLENHQE